MLLNMAFFVCGFHVTFISTHLPAYVSDLGLGAAIGATALALIGLFNIFGSLAAGALGGRYSKTRLLSIIYGSRALVIAVYVLLPASSATTIAFGATFGLLWLSTVPLTSGIVTGQFGTLHSGALFGIVFFSHQVGAFTGVWMGGELFDATGSYRVRVVHRPRPRRGGGGHPPVHRRATGPRATTSGNGLASASPRREQRRSW